MTTRRWMLRLSLFLAILAVSVWYLNSPYSCFGCGGLEFAPGTTAAEKQAIAQQMVELVVAGVYVTLLLAVLMVAGRVAWTSFTKREDGR